MHHTMLFIYCKLSGSFKPEVITLSAIGIGFRSIEQEAEAILEEPQQEHREWCAYGIE